MGQYCFACSGRRASCRACGQSGDRHCTAGQYDYVPLGRNLVALKLHLPILPYAICKVISVNKKYIQQCSPHKYPLVNTYKTGNLCLWQSVHALWHCTQTLAHELVLQMQPVHTEVQCPTCCTVLVRDWLVSYPDYTHTHTHMQTYNFELRSCVPPNTK